MNVGEYLVSKSPLGSGTARAHLLAMQTGDGGKTIFAAQMTVCVEEPQLTLVQRDSSRSAQHVAAETNAVQQTGPNRICVMTLQVRIDVTTKQKAWFLTQRKPNTLHVSAAPKSVVSHNSRRRTLKVTPRTVKPTP